MAVGGGWWRMMADAGGAARNFSQMRFPSDTSSLKGWGDVREWSGAAGPSFVTNRFVTHEFVRATKERPSDRTSRVTEQASDLPLRRLIGSVSRKMKRGSGRRVASNVKS